VKFRELLQYRLTANIQGVHVFVTPRKQIYLMGSLNPPGRRVKEVVLSIEIKETLSICVTTIQYLATAGFQKEIQKIEPSFNNLRNSAGQIYCRIIHTPILLREYSAAQPN
jgi:hypothetical protein